MRGKIIWTGLMTSVALTIIGCFPIVTDKLGSGGFSPQDQNEGPQQPPKVATTGTQGAKPGILDLYKKLKPGMTPQEVEAILGKPILPPTEQPNNYQNANYLGSEFAERTLLPYESPLFPAGIYVTYHDGKLVTMSYNSQWVKQ
jgi:hypothetical protein